MIWRVNILLTGVDTSKLKAWNLKLDFFLWDLNILFCFSFVYFLEGIVFVQFILIVKYLDQIVWQNLIEVIIYSCALRTQLNYI